VRRILITVERPIAVFAAASLDEHAGPTGHPEFPGRLDASLEGIGAADLRDAVRLEEPRLATVDEMALVHTRDYLDWLEAFCLKGGGAIDADTYAVGGTWMTARRAAGAVLDAVDALASDACDVAFAGSRPPGHHAVAGRAMGFCLVNNVAVAAASLAERGERVAIVDWDVHHGNGTQDLFYDDPRVFYASLHQSPHYPGTGRPSETGGDGAPFTNLNLPMPAGTRGDVFRQAVDGVIAPALERFAPTWLFISAGFDAHRLDPLADLELTAADYADLAARLQQLVPPRRTIVVLEGGYDLNALRMSTGATLSALVGEHYRPEHASSGKADLPVLAAAKQLWQI